MRSPIFSHHRHFSSLTLDRQGIEAEIDRTRERRIHIISILHTIFDVHSSPDDQSAFRLSDVWNAAVRSALAARFPFLKTLDLQYQTLWVEDLASIALEVNCIETLNLRSGSMFARKLLHHQEEVLHHYDDAREHSAMMSSATAFSNIRGLGSLMELNLKDSKLYRDAAYHVLANLPQLFPKLVLDLSDNTLSSVGHMGLIRALPDLVCVGWCFRTRILKTTFYHFWPLHWARRPFQKCWT